MGILRRAGRMVTANVNDLFDQFEDPAKMVWTDLERQFERAEWGEIEAEVHLDIEPFRRDPVLQQWERLEQDKKIEAELASLKGRGSA